jgi:hypothetical protein
MKSVAILVALVITLCGSAAWSANPQDGGYKCAVSESAQAALDAAARGTSEMTLTVTGQTFKIMPLALAGTIDVAGSSDGAFKTGAGDFFAASEGHILKGPNNLSFGRAAFANDASGVPIAYFALYGGTYHLICFEQSAAQANFSGAPAAAVAEALPEEPTEEKPAEELTDEQKLELNFAEAPEQKGKEVELFGRVSLLKPDEGYYACKATTYFSDGDTRTNDQIDSDDDHIGFDLFADGSVRLKKTDGTYEDSGNKWRHNPGNGVVLFNEGSLSIYFKWPVHVRKKLSAELPEVSILYRTDYDYDGPLDDMTICAFAGPVQSKSPIAEIAERAQKNSNPPPPGSKRISGLFYQQVWQTMFGPNFTTYQVDYYYYHYFQDNGYVWLNDPPDDGDFEKLGCNKPMVDEDGEPTCTTYTIEDGLFSKPTIRIGHNAAVPFEYDDTSVTIDGTGYFLMPAQDNLRLAKTLSYFSYTGVLMREGYISFGTDGTFERSSSSGVLFTQEIPDVSRTTVTSYNPGDDLKGTYEINGHTITFTTTSGKIAKQFFGFISDGMIMVGGQPYIDRSD